MGVVCPPMADEPTDKPRLFPQKVRDANYAKEAGYITFTDG